MNRSQDDPSLLDMQFRLRSDYNGAGWRPHDDELPGADDIMTMSHPTIPSNGWDPAEELAEMLYGATDVDPPAPLLDRDGRTRHRINRRRPRPGSRFLAERRRIIPVAILVTIISACSAAMLGWSISYSYNQLFAIALLVEPRELAQWWPLTVYGPWFVAGLSIMRACLQNRPAGRSWAVMLISSGTAVVLCSGHSANSALAMVIFGIPPITALVCFRELVGQLSSPPPRRHAAHAAKQSNDG
ncbi:DUF2637 domain-containing protein [Streptomyces sp. NPDC001530]|uniref:DUF2637 domain-containing protein n=1 Tax=Streptomyces sp. NPDC001530 TaxID=3364582 RepID=UPI0036994636